MANIREKMNQRVRAIIIESGKVLLINRIKERKSYWVIPGGGVEIGENHEQAIKRECLEELGIQVRIGKLFLQRMADKLEIQGQQEFFYLCEFISGEVGTGQGPEFQPGTGNECEFKASWIDIKSIHNLDLRPHEVRDAIIVFIENEKN